MTKFEKTSSFTRRSVLLGGGAARRLDRRSRLAGNRAVNSVSLCTRRQAAAHADQLSSYIAVNADGSVSAFFGKMDMGHGLHVALGQMVARSWTFRFKSVKVIMGDTASVKQGGASGLDRHPARRQADAHGGGGSAPRAGRDGGGQARRSGRPAHRQRRRGRQCRRNRRASSPMRS